MFVLHCVVSCPSVEEHKQCDWEDKAIITAAFHKAKSLCIQDTVVHPTILSALCQVEIDSACLHLPWTLITQGREDRSSSRQAERKVENCLLKHFPERFSCCPDPTSAQGFILLVTWTACSQKGLNLPIHMTAMSCLAYVALPWKAIWRDPVINKGKVINNSWKHQLQVK